jgi:hypothetical protein
LYFKTSGACKDDTISEKVAYPSLQEDLALLKEQASPKLNCNDSKQLRMDRSQHKKI